MRAGILSIVRRSVALFVLLVGATAVGPDAATRPAEPINVGFLVLEGVYNSELMAPWDIFHHTVFHSTPGMRVFTVGRKAGPVTTFEGLRLDVEYALEEAPRIDVLVVPSAQHNMDSDLKDRRLIDWVRARGCSARYVLSLCDGAFVLAEAGLLDGRRCTTFPGDIAAFRKRYAGLNVVEGVSFVADGTAITGAGGALSYDPALYLVQTLYGDAVARGVGRGLVLRWDLDKVRHLAVGTHAVGSYLPGDRIGPEVTAESADGTRVSLAEVVTARDGVRAVVLTILAGAEAVDQAKRGGFWCEDSFSEIAGLRHLRLTYGPRGVLFLGVLCPPVRDEALFGYDEGAFRRQPDDDPVYRRNRDRFVEESLKLVDRADLPFDVVLFDPRFAMLDGRFKWFQDTQIYGTPTIWVLTPDMEIAGPPFFMNVYEWEGRKLRYGPDDISVLIDRVLLR